MKKWLLIGSLALVAVIGAALFMGVGFVNAQAPTPGTPSGGGIARRLDDGRGYPHVRVHARGPG